MEEIKANIMKNLNIDFGNGEKILPIQLISYNSNNELQIEPKAIEFLESLESESFGTLSIVGKYRTGKSYLVNSVLLNNARAFEVGPTINPCTKGLWIWPRLVNIDNENNKEKTGVLVIDTEGIGAFDAEENHDVKIFLLAMLLSSYFIYNSVGSIDEKAIQSLSLIINLGKHLQKSNDKEFEELVNCFPSFLWVVRDFALRLEDSFGTPLTPKEYLDNALKPQKGLSENVEQKNRIRRMITNFFKEKDCFVMVRPTHSEKDLQNLTNLDFEDLRKEFVEQIFNLRRKVYTRVKAKTFKGKKVNGASFLTLTRLFCDSINKGSIPSIENSWVSLCKVESERLLRVLKQKYSNLMEENLKSCGSVLEEDLNLLHQKIWIDIKKEFKEKALGEDVQAKESELLNNINEIFWAIVGQNNKKTKEELEIQFETYTNDLRDKLQNGQLKKYFDLKHQMEIFRKKLEEKHSKNSAIVSHIYYLSSNGLQNLSEIFVSNIENFSSRSEYILQEKVDFLEENLRKEKQGNEKNLNEFFTKLKDLEVERARQKIIIENLEHELQETKNKVVHENKSTSSRIQELESELKELKNKTSEQLRNKDVEMAQKDEASKGVIRELEKQVALLQQKEELNEADHLLAKEKIVKLNTDLKSLIEEHNSICEELENSKKELASRSEVDKEEVERLVKENARKEKKINDLKSEKIQMTNDWKIEKGYMEKQIKLAEGRVKENKKMNEFILKALNKKPMSPSPMESSTENQSILQTNKNLSQAVEKAEQRCFDLEKKVEKMRKYQKLIKYSVGLECCHCYKSFKTSMFQAHIIMCRKNKKAQQNSSEKIPSYDVTFETKEEDRLKKEYIIDVTMHKKTWTLKKTFKSFKILTKQIIAQISNFQAPSIFSYFYQPSNKESIFLKNRPEFLEERRIKILELLNEINKLDFIRDSNLFRTFLSIDIHIKNLPEDENADSDDSFFHERNLDLRSSMLSATVGLSGSKPLLSLLSGKKKPIFPTNSDFESKEDFSSNSMNLELKTKRSLRTNKENCNNKENVEDEGEPYDKDKEDLRSSLQNNSFKQLLHNIHRGGNGSASNSAGLPATPKAILQKFAANMVRDIPQPKLCVTKNSQLKKLIRTTHAPEEYGNES